MLKIKLNNFNKFFLTAFILFVGVFNVANASSLVLSPNGGTYRVGDVIVVRLLVSSPNVSINAVSSKLRYTQDNLSLNSISKSGSIISIWAQEPTFSNTAGVASFEGVTLGGYTGDGATVVTMSFRATAVGEGAITFSSAAVLANDGEGTNILKSQNQASFAILEALPKQDTKPIIPTKESIKEVLKETVALNGSINNIAKKPDSGSTTPVINYYVVGIGSEYLTLIIIWVLLLFVFVFLYFHYRYKIKNKLENFKKDAKWNFDRIRKDEKSKNTKILERDIEDAQKTIIDDINDIEKI